MAGRVICLAGPTACGKTTLGVQIAKQYGGEVVSADSMQIYKGLTIGTAAPTEAEMGGVPHHMIGVADPGEKWSAARYVQEAGPVVDGILARGKLPVIVGGTGLWQEALVRGRTFPKGDADGAVRAELEARLSREGVGPLLDALRAIDPASAERLHPADEKRILRALEIYYETGRTMTEHNRESRKQPPRYEAVWIGLQFRKREDMKALIDRRVDAMAAAGLMEEVRMLAGLPADATARQAIGYKECLGVLEGTKTLDEALAEVKLRTRQYAKRQLTWLRKNPEIQWIYWEAERDFAWALQVSTEILAAAGVY